LKNNHQKRELKEFSKKVAIKKCGKGAEHEECRRKVSTEVREREKKFRKTVLKACDCKARLSEKCQNDSENKKCTKKYNRCAKRCLRRACKIRARLECISDTDKTKCRRSSRKSCRRVNRIKKERTLRKNKEIDEIIVREVDVSKKWKPYCKKVAERKCGKGAEHKVCRKRVRKQIHQKESTFRRNALRSCACKSKHSKCEENKAGRCAKKYNRCSRRCLKKACKTRAKTECAGKQSEIKCRRETVKRCKNLHHHHKRHAKKRKKT